MALKRSHQLFFLTVIGFVLVLGGIYKFHKNSPKEIEAISDIQILPRSDRPRATFDRQITPPEANLQGSQNAGVRNPDQSLNEQFFNEEESIWEKMASKIKGLMPFAKTQKSVLQTTPESALQPPSKFYVGALPESDRRTTPKSDLQISPKQSDLQIPQNSSDQFLTNEDSIWDKLVLKIKSLNPFGQSPKSDLQTQRKSDLQSLQKSDFKTLRKPDLQNRTKSLLRILRKSGLRTPRQFLKTRLSKAESVWAKQVLNIQRHPPPYNDAPRTIWNYYYPTFTCPYLVERIGDVIFSGKWVCGLSEISRQVPPLKQVGPTEVQLRPCVVYSYGLSTETSFEEEILQRTNCTVHGYDHTVNLDNLNAMVGQKFPNRSTFQQFGIGTKDEGLLRTLKTAMKENGDEFIDILKMDVEGAEGGALPQIFQDFNGTFPFGQLLVEIHLGETWGLKGQKALKAWWALLEEGGLRPFSKEVNLYPKDVCCFEVSFLNVRIGHFALKIPPVRKFSVTATDKIVAKLLKQTTLESKD